MRQCDLCNSSLINRHKNPAHRRDIYRCSKCGLVFTSPIPRGEALVRASSDDPMVFRDPQELFKRQESYFAFMLNELAELSHHGKLLDIGCGFGQMLRLARDRGFNVRGVEIQESSADYARRSGIDVFCGTVEQRKFDDGTFDVVTMWEVLEHVESPSATLREVSRIMKEDGILSIVVPNVASKNAKRDPYWWKPYHFYHFSNETLSKYLRASGFDVLKAIINPHLTLKRSPEKKRECFSRHRKLISYIRGFMSLPILSSILLRFLGEGSITIYARKK